MKKLIVSLLVLAGIAAAPATSKAAGNFCELNVSYGGYTVMDAADYADNWSHVHTAWGSVNATLWFNVLPKLAIGPSYSFSSAHTDGGSVRSSVTYNSILANVKYQYYSNSIVKLYAHVGLGAEISHLMPKYGDSYNNAYFGFQVTPVGATVDLTRNFGIYGELGFGCQGLLQVGFKVGF